MPAERRAQRRGGQRPVRDSSPKPSEVQSKCMQRLQTCLGRSTITIHEARDGFLECVVVSYLEGAKAGFKGPVDVAADPADVARVTAGILRRRLAGRGASFEHPTVEALAAITDEVSQELHLAALPEAVRQMHEKVVGVLLDKARAHSAETDAIVDAIGRSELGAGLGPAERERLAEYLHTRRFSEGDLFVQHGSPADFAMLLIEGSAEVVSNEQKLAVLDLGDVLGESMFADEGTRSADVRALSDGSAAVLTLETYDAMLAHDNSLALRCKGFFEALYVRNRERKDRFSFQDTTRYVGLIAHNDIKSALVDFVRAHRRRLQRYPLVATGTTGTLLHRETGVTLTRKVKSGPLGGDQAVGALVSTGHIECVLFFRDPLSAHPHHADIEALGRLCDVYQIPFATNTRTAEAVLDYLERGAVSGDLKNPAPEKYQSRQSAALERQG